jgi:hypothetical protein
VDLAISREAHAPGEVADGLSHPCCCAVDAERLGHPVQSFRLYSSSYSGVQSPWRTEQQDQDSSSGSSTGSKILPWIVITREATAPQPPLPGKKQQD